MPSIAVLNARTVAIIALLLAGLTGGCDPADEPAEDFPGASVVRNGTQGRWSAGEAWRLSPLVRIGSPDGDERDTFGMIVGFALDGLGRVWIADGLQQNVRVYTEDGTYVRTVGRKGRGPQEFQSIGGIALGSDGNLWVPDFGNMRFAVYDTSGSLVTTHRRDYRISVTPWPGRMDAQRRLYDIAVVPASGDSTTQGVVRYSSEFQPLDTFRLPPFEAAVASVSRTDGNNREVNRVTIPFSPTQEWAVDPEGYVWVAVTDRYRFVRHRFGGAVDLVVDREHTPDPVTDAERDRIMESYPDFKAKGGRIDASLIPRTKPALNSFFFDDHGNLWSMPVHPRGQPSPFDIFGPTGEYLGRVVPPLQVMSGPDPLVRGNRVVGVTTDADGVQSLIVFKLEKPSP